MESFVHSASAHGVSLVPGIMLGAGGAGENKAGKNVASWNKMLKFLQRKGFVPLSRS
jgi:hypothetical protein